VTALARFVTPSKAAALLKEEFGLQIEKQAAQHYDPTKYTGRKLSEEYKKLFEYERAAYLEGVQSVPIARQGFRVNKLFEMAGRAELKGNDVLAAQFLKQAAEELGGKFTNRQEHSGPGGKPIETVNMSLDEWRAQAAGRERDVDETMTMFESGAGEDRDA
jgi:hypothetical protein